MLKYVYFFMTNTREVAFYDESRVGAEKQYQETFGTYPTPSQFIRRENA